MDDSPNDAFRLSPQQERLRLLMERDGGAPFQARCRVRIDGTPDADRFVSALREVVERYEILRTAFRRAGGAMHQVVEEHVAVSYERHDLGALPPDAQPQALDALGRRLAETPFDLERPPLLKCALVRLADAEHVLLLALPALAADRTGLDILLREIARCYAGEAADEEDPMQYGDLAEWQWELLESEDTPEGREYWNDRRLDAPLAVQLPGAHTRPGAELEPRLVQQAFPPPLADGVDALLGRTKVTAEAFFLACWQVLLARFTGRTDLVVGTAFDGRKFEEVADALGLLARFLPVPARLEGRPRFVDAVEQLAEALKERAEWQEYFAWERVFESSSDIAQMPLAFELIASPASIETGALRLTVEEMVAVTERFQLKLACHPQGFELHYDANAVDDSMAQRLSASLLSLVGSAVERPEAAIDELRVLSPGGFHQVALDWGAPQAPARREPTLHALFEAKAERVPGHVAVACSGQETTYRELNEKANQLAHRLVEWGVGPETIVGLCLERCLDMVVGVLGILKAGGAYLPLDPAYPEERLAFLLADTAVKVVVTREDVKENLPSCDARLLDLAADGEALANNGTENPSHTAAPSSLAYVIYTSGSTGRPKGVQVEHRQVTRLFSGTRERFGFGESDVWTLFHSYAFDFSVWELWGALLYGGRLVVVPFEVSRTPERCLDLLLDQSVTVFNQTPSAFGQLMQAAQSSGKGRGLALRYVIFGGEALELESLLPWYDLTGDRGPTLVNMYGITETTVHVTWRFLSRADAEGSAGSLIGRALPDLGVVLLDRRGQPTPVTVAGEIHVGGAGVTRGYLGRPALTAQRFVPDPWSVEPGTRFYRAGDLARYLPSGELEYLGRIDHQVKIRGFRIELGEVRAACTGHPAVRDAVVLMQGETADDRRLAAYLVPETDAEVETSAVRDFVREQLPEYMVPAAWAVVDELPLTANGKLDRAALVRRAGAGKDSAAARYTKPRNEAERLVADIWQDLLQVERVGARDNFFDLGGHSLLVIRMRNRLVEAFQRDVSRTDLFRYPTVEALAELLSSDTDDEAGRRRVERGTERAERRRASAGRSSSDRDDHSIAVVGMAARFPGSRNVDELWQGLRDGVESITFFSDEELLEVGVAQAALDHPDYVRGSGYVEDLDHFDARLFGINPRDAEITDPQHRIFLECAWEALEHAGYDPETCGKSIGVYAGSGISKYLIGIIRNPEQAGPVGEMQVQLGNDKDFLPTRVSYKLDLHGPSVTVQTACSTSLVATHLACQALLADECDMAMAGGVSLLTLGKTGYVYQEDGILSPDGHCRAFDAKAKGTALGSGAGIIVLKRLSEALADGDTIHGVIRGSALNNDGADKIGFTAPGPEGQAAVVAEALSMAGIEAAAVSYVETHGSGTPLGDPIEMSALRQVFGSEPGRRCAVGSIKTNIGHTDAAAGVAGIFKTVMALKHGQIPPHLHFAEPNAEVDFEASPFFVPTELTPWQSFGHPAEGGRRYAGVSSFGLGGTNAHIVLEEPPAARSGDEGRPWQLLVLSAASETALEGGTERLLHHFEDHAGAHLADVAYTLQVGRRRLPQRRFAVCRDVDDAGQVLGSRDPNRLLGAHEERTRRPVAFLFPGLGDHYVQMGRELYDREPAFREEVDRWSAYLEPRLGTDLRRVLYPGEAPRAAPDSAATRGPDLKQLLGRGPAKEGVGHGEGNNELDRIELTHPAIVVIELALARLWREWGIEPESMIGYSLGEYTAACLAGVWTPEETLELVAERARLVSELEPGAMLAVPMTEDELRPLLAAEVAVAAINTPGVTVLAGPVEAVDALQASLAERDVASRRLASSHAFHSPMMEPIAERFAERLRQASFEAPAVPFVSNVTGTWITAEEATDPDYWVRHLRRTVRFAQGVEELYSEPDRLLLEVGPGQALSTAARQHPARGPGHGVVTSLRDQRDPQSDVAFALGALGQLWLAGATVDWQGFHQRHERRRVALPTYAFDRQRYWIDTSKAAPAARRPQGKIPDLAEWFYVPAWKLSALPRPIPQDGLEAATWLVFVDAGGLGARLVERLEQEGQDVVAVTAGAPFSGLDSNLDNGRTTLEAHRKEDYDALFAALREQDRIPRTIAHFWTVDSAAGQLDFPSFEEAQYRGLYSLYFIAQALVHAGLTRDFQLAVISDGLQPADGSETLRPEKATLLGALKVIPQEYRNLTCRSIDVLRPAPGSRAEGDLVNRLLADLARAAEQGRAVDRFVAYRGRGRYVEDYDPVRLDNAGVDEAVLRDKGVYLVTGGFGEVGRRLTRHLATTCGARLVLTGRSPCPAREEWDAWLERAGENDPLSRKILHARELEELGAEVWAVQADVADRGRMREVIAETLKRFGDLHGVVHLAGELSRDKLLTSLEDAGPDACRPQFRAKVGGLFVLEEVLDGLDLDFCVLFSSLSSILGGLGFAAYAAGNTFMDAFAHRRNRQGDVPWLSLDWDGWGDENAGQAGQASGGMGGSMAGLIMTPSESVEAFHRALSIPAASQVIISTGDLRPRLEQWVLFAGEQAEEQESAPTSLHPRPSLATPYEAPEGETEQSIAGLWQEHLGIAEVGRHDNFFQLGGDSLLATQLISRLRQTLKVELPLRVFFTAPTVAQLAEAALEGQYQQAELSEIEKALQEIEGLSAEELALELQAEEGA